VRPIVLASAANAESLTRTCCTHSRSPSGPTRTRVNYELTVVVGAARNGVTLLEIGYDLDEQGRIVIVHAMPARKNYL
jgi:hypothetical protein